MAGARGVSGRAHRHGVMFPEIEYQNGDDNNLSHPFSDSSRGVRYCDR
jgi:hypothetical protein